MTDNSLPFASVIIPAYNEERHIRGCLLSLLRGSYPSDRWEIIVADGMSRDRTREEIGRVAAESAVPITVIDNPRRVTPVALNLAIGRARGQVIIRVDAHTEYGEDYVARCVQVLQESGADNVGGPMETRPGADTAIALAIALAMAHPFGVGNSAFRTQSEAREADTVPFGCFRREVFMKVGLFDERLWRNQDFEFNQRIRRAGGRLWLDPRLHSAYYSRATLAALMRHAWINGFWNALSHSLHPYSFCLRHALPVGFVLGLAAAMAASALVLGTGATAWRVPAMLLWLPYLLYLAADLVVAVRLACSPPNPNPSPPMGKGVMKSEERVMKSEEGVPEPGEKASAVNSESSRNLHSLAPFPIGGEGLGLGGERWRLFPALLVVFPAFHVWYGAGLAWGWITVLLRRFPWGPEDGIPSLDANQGGEQAAESIGMNEK